MKAGINAEHVRAEWPRLDEVPFDAAYRSATLHRGPDGQTMLSSRAPPEELPAPGMPDDPAWRSRIASRRIGRRACARICLQKKAFRNARHRSGGCATA